MAVYLGNDNYQAQLRSTWISSPADTTLAVNAIPTNVPTIVTLGFDTDDETLFSVTGTSGTNSSNYALTGVVRLRGANKNLAVNTTVTCLNNEEFFNQYGTLFGRLTEMVDTTGLDVAQITTPTAPDADRNKIYPKDGGKWYIEDENGVESFVQTVISNTVVSHATPSINTDTTDIFTITALAAAITSMTTNLTGTPKNGQKLIIRIKDDGTARAITWGASFVNRGGILPTTTVLGKYHYVGLIYNSTASVWDCVAATIEA
jgi:hypothetical protein